jgi:hypothetical protein
MITCKNCNFDKNPDSAKECEMCGAELVRLCSCGFELKPHWKLCPECGTPVAQEAAANAEAADGTGAGEQQDLAKGIEGIIRGHFKDDGWSSIDRLYLSPMIPKDKLINATNHFITLDDGEEVLALYDTTVFGSCKEGWALTTKGFYGKYTDAFVRIVYTDIKIIKVIEKVLYINGKQAYCGFSVVKPARLMIRAILNDIVEYINGQTVVE